MGFREEYAAYEAKKAADAAQGGMRAKTMMSFMRPGLKYMHPVRMYGNLWHVGDKDVCVHLVDTGDGLLLFDSAYTGNGAMLINAIWEAGFDPSNIKWVVHSHGHFDHFGQANLLKDMFGCKLGLSEPDARMFREEPSISMIHRSPNCYESLFEPDFLIHDGETITFGNTPVKFVMVPGHTAGTIAAFFDVTEDGKTLRAGYYGGFGFNTLDRKYLAEFGDPECRMRQTYLKSLAKVREEHVDIFMGNHPNNNNLFEKYRKLQEDPDTNPFIDETEWQRYLDKMRDDLLRKMQDPDY